MTSEEYLRDPCRASSLPFWKAEQTLLPPHMAVIRDDLFRPERHRGADEPYFKLIHRLGDVGEPTLPEPFVLAPCDAEVLSAHINVCYDREGISPAALDAYRTHSVHDPALWIAVTERGSGRIAASGIAELDGRIGEGVLEWIQVSPGLRRMGLGRFVVCELLRRMRGRAGFVTVSGRLNNPDAPMALYLSCGFADPVIWHVVTEN